MPRTATNPLKYKSIPPLPPVVVAAITHLPNQTGYHAERMEIVKTSLLSMRQFSEEQKPHILIWDNGSCAEFRKWLRYTFEFDQVVFSPNVGKSSAMAAIFRMFPPHTIIACADDDILYYPNWLGAQLEVLDRFPPAVVSGWPIRPIFAKNNSHTLEWADKTAEITLDRFIPQEWMDDYAKSVGLEIDHAPSDFKNGFDARISYNGMLAYATSQHCQFVTRAGSIAPLTEWNSYGSADESQLDKAIDESGLLRLSTVERYTRHMGNALDAELRADIEELMVAPNTYWNVGEVVYEGVGLG